MSSTIELVAIQVASTPHMQLYVDNYLMVKMIQIINVIKFNLFLVPWHSTFVF